MSDETEADLNAIIEDIGQGQYNPVFELQVRVVEEPYLRAVHDRAYIRPGSAVDGHMSVVLAANVLVRGLRGL